MSGLTRDDITYIMNLIDGSDYDELILEMGDLKLELRKPGAVRPALTAASAPQPVASTPPPPAPEPAMESGPVGSGTEVPAPLLGTYYHAPKPGAAPFVAIGDRVTADTVIGIIEVMKLMNQVQAGIAGTVTEIVAPNGELVEHGQTLIRVQPD